MGNELVAEVKESETVWTGSRLLEDGADLKEAFESKSWVAGGLATAATAADAAAAAIDPLGEALSAGVGWVIEHLSPLKDWLNELAGDSDAVTAAASTWTNIATKLNSCATDLDKVRSSRLAGQESLAVATFKTLQAGSASHLRMTGGVAGAISSGLTVASMIVRMVHDMVRDAISDVIGKLLSKASITVLTAGVAAPWAVSSIATDVSSWATRLAKEVTDVVTSAKNLKGLLSKANRLLDDVAAAFTRIPAKVSEAVTTKVEAAKDLASTLKHPQHALAGLPGISMRRAGDMGKAKPTVYRPSKAPTRPKTPRPNPNEGRWGVKLDDAANTTKSAGHAANGAKGAGHAADGAKGASHAADGAKSASHATDAAADGAKSASHAADAAADGAKGAASAAGAAATSAKRAGHAADAATDGAKNASKAADAAADGAKNASHTADAATDGAKNASHAADTATDGAKNASHTADAATVGAKGASHHAADTATDGARSASHATDAATDGAKNAEHATDGTKHTDEATKADAHESAEADSSAATGEGTTQWDDPAKVQEWHDELPTKTRTASTPAYDYQHKVLGTDVERLLTADNGDTVWADSVTTDGTITKAWDAKHTGGGHSALYQGKGPEFLMKKFDDEMRVYGEVIRSSGNPVSSLTLVTNTPESLEFLGQRARDILGPDVELHIQLKP